MSGKIKSWGKLEIINIRHVCTIWSLFHILYLKTFCLLRSRSHNSLRDESWNHRSCFQSLWITTLSTMESVHPDVDCTVCVFRYLFRSGNPEHPGDKLYNTSVQVLSSSRDSRLTAALDNSQHPTEFPLTEDRFYVINHFSHDSGIAEGTPPSWLGPVDVLRLYVQYPSTSWAILNEVAIIGIFFTLFFLTSVVIVEECGKKFCIILQNSNL